MIEMTHDDPVARAIFGAVMLNDEEAQIAAQAARRAVLEEMREMVRRKSVIVNNYATSGDYIRSFLDAYGAEMGIK